MKCVQVVDATASVFYTRANQTVGISKSLHIQHLYMYSIFTSTESYMYSIFRVQHFYMQSFVA